jgi:hypothetical protein
MRTTALNDCGIDNGVDGGIDGGVGGDGDGGIHCLSPMELFLFHVNVPGNDVLLYGCV